MSETQAGHLVVCPTPIGNLEDVTLRVLSALRTVDLVACEDTRRTRKLLDRHEVGAKLVSYHEHNERKRSAELVEAMRSGKKVALVSDSGTPLVSDPGYALVRACVAAGLEVEVLPGPVRRADRAGCVRPAARPLALRRLPAAEEERAAQGARGARRHAGRLRVAQPAARDAQAARGDRPAPRRGRLPRADEGARGGRARHGRRAARPLRRRRRRARSCWWSAPRRAAHEAAPLAAIAAMHRLVDAGAKPREAAKVVADLTGASANALYDAVAGA